MIPEAAVDAAAIAVHDEFCRDQYHAGHVGPACYDYKDEARRILEAAAPHMRQAFFLEMNLRAVQDELTTAPIYPLGKIEDKRT